MKVMRMEVLGTGALAVALGAAWVRAGHEVLVGGRSPDNARAAAGRMGATARAVSPAEAVAGRDAVLVAVPWQGLAGILDLAGPPAGRWPGPR